MINVIKTTIGILIIFITLFAISCTGAKKQSNREENNESTELIDVISEAAQKEISAKEEEKKRLENLRLYNIRRVQIENAEHKVEIDESRFSPTSSSSSYYYLPHTVDIVKRHAVYYDFIKDIPGRQVGNRSIIVGDFNNDGYDEVMSFIPDWLNSEAWKIYIFGGYGIYPKSDEPYLITEIDWGLTTWEQGPPVQFVTYKNMEGFILYAPGGNWVFYTWNAEDVKYKRIEQVNYEEVSPQWPGVVFGFAEGEQYGIMDGIEERLSNRVYALHGISDKTLIDVQYVDFKIPGLASVVASYLGEGIECIVFLLDSRYKEIRFRLPDYDFFLLSRWEQNYGNLGNIYGRQVGEAPIFINDYNKDGFEEILVFVYENRNSRRIELFHYDHETKKIESSFRNFYSIPEQEYGPPIQFVSYNGVEGFVFYTDNAGWYFYSWDEAEKKYRNKGTTVRESQINYSDVVPQWSDVRR